MDPIAALAITFDIKLIIITIGAVGDIQQDARIAEGLLDAHAADIHGATCQMIARGRASCQPIHLRRTIAAGDDERDIFLVPIEFMICEPEFFQPVLAEILQILDSHVAGDITVGRLVAGFGNLPERKMLGEVD